jgi:oligoribonuclease
MEPNDLNLGWIDLEMTGLDPKDCVILEIACLVTDKDLNILAEGPVLAIHQSDATLDAMDDWNQKHHGHSGLIRRVKDSTVTAEEAECQAIAFFTQHLKPKTSPLCGNSIHMDRLFISKYMPKLEAFFHYRNIDVSTVKELAKRWYGPDAQPKKAEKHQALDDIRESVGELRHYREKYFKSV